MKQLIIDNQGLIVFLSLLLIGWYLCRRWEKQRDKEIKEYKNRYPRPGKVVKHWKDNIIK